jgi:hypothetical protein
LAFSKLLTGRLIFFKKIRQKFVGFMILVFLSLAAFSERGFFLAFFSGKKTRYYTVKSHSGAQFWSGM